MAQSRPLLRPSSLSQLPLMDTSQPPSFQAAVVAPVSPSPAIQAKMDLFSGPGTAPLLLNHALNQVKQTDQLMADIGKTAVSFEPNTDGSSVNIDCNPGFYHHIVHPFFSQLSEGYQTNHPDTSFSLIKNRLDFDTNKIEQSRFLQFLFYTGSVEQNLHVHLYHSTRRVQVQGAALMPDKSTAAVWFVNHILKDVFTTKARTSRQSIDDFHDSLLAMAASSTSSSRAPGRRKVAATSANAGRKVCIQCNKTIHGNIRQPPICPKGICTGFIHKECILKHTSCPAPFTFPLASPPPPSLSAPPLALSPPAFPALTDSVPVRAGTMAGLSLGGGEKRTAEDANLSALDVSTAAAPQPLACLSSFAVTSLPAPSSTTAVTSFTFSATPHLPPSLPHPTGTRPKSLKPPAKRSRTPATTPEAVQVEYLQNEISLAQAKITSLQAALNSRDDTILILGERIKTMEEPRFDRLRAQYLSPTPPPPTASPPYEAEMAVEQVRLEMSAMRGQLMSELTTLKGQLFCEMTSLKEAIVSTANHTCTHPPTAATSPAVLTPAPPPAFPFPPPPILAAASPPPGPHQSRAPSVQPRAARGAPSQPRQGQVSSHSQNSGRPPKAAVPLPAPPRRVLLPTPVWLPGRAPLPTANSPPVYPQSVAPRPPLTHPSRRANRSKKQQPGKRLGGRPLVPQPDISVREATGRLWRVRVFPPAAAPPAHSHNSNTAHSTNSNTVHTVHNTVHTDPSTARTAHSDGPQPAVTFQASARARCDMGGGARLLTLQPAVPTQNRFEALADLEN